MRGRGEILFKLVPSRGVGQCNYDGLTLNMHFSSFKMPIPTLLEEDMPMLIQTLRPMNVCNVLRLNLSRLFVGKKSPFNGIDNVATVDASGRFAVREAQKLHFLRG